jgi:phenylpyruvate tautomerase PptA (4-oxalocrotonate tautomerase family)
MPLVRIELVRGRSQEWIAALGAAVHAAMVEVLGVPQRDQFRVVTEHERGRLHYSRDYLDVERSDGFVLVEIALSAGRSTEVKQQFYRRAAELVAAGTGLRKEDLMIVLIENQRDCWSFGAGEAQYVVLPRERWR